MNIMSRAFTDEARAHTHAATCACWKLFAVLTPLRRNCSERSPSDEKLFHANNVFLFSLNVVLPDKGARIERES